MKKCLWLCIRRVSNEQKNSFDYLIYMRTNNGMYKLLISGSDKDIVEHYKEFVNDIEFK